MYVVEVWNLVRPRLLDAAGGRDAAPGKVRPLLLHEAAPLARYDGMDVLHAVAEQARAGGGPVWLLCPMDDPGQLPRLDTAVVPILSENEWVVPPDAWVANEHRSRSSNRYLVS